METIPSAEIRVRSNRKSGKTRCVSILPPNALKNPDMCEGSNGNGEVALALANFDDQNTEEILNTSSNKSTNEQKLSIAKDTIKSFHDLIDRKDQKEIEKKKDYSLRQQIASLNEKVEKLLLNKKA